MKEKKIAVITESESDLLNTLEDLDCSLIVLKPGELSTVNLDTFYSIAILGGASEAPVLFHPKERVMIEEQLKKGTKIFAEYCASIGNVYYEPPVNTRYDRLVFCSDKVELPAMEKGDLIDDQCGMRIRPHEIACAHSVPILQYAKIHAHDKVVVSKDMLQNISDRALWFDDPDNLLVCSFKISNFIRARFAPQQRVNKIIVFILEWLLDEKIELNRLDTSYSLNSFNEGDGLTSNIKACVQNAMKWFEDSGLLLNEGKDGIYEGFGTEIYPDGSQRMSQIIRTDCVGEASLAYLMDFLLNDNMKSLETSNHLSSFCFNYMQCKEEGQLNGMMRWTNEAWGVCYQDDVARAIIPQLMKCLYLEHNGYLNECISALRFLIKTTGTDGTREFRTDNIRLNAQSIHKMASVPSNLPSAHYNAYYHAALLLAYKQTGIEEFRQIGVRGLETIMSVYPKTIREHSQTQENCRLILPLTWLYWVTKEDKHKQWLYTVVNDLKKLQHTSGSYLEWDEGYQASMRNEVGEGESSLLTSNGEPVVDLLYSNNWLPFSFIQAYFVTGDLYFKQLWEEIAMFMVKTQIRSENSDINGAWARGIDVDRMEVFGSPADAGWGPWAIESGWSVAEITSGLMMGLLEEKLIKFHQ